MKSVRGRFAPTPSGHIHLGNASAALVAWLSVRSKNGELIWRLEDLDGPRLMEGAAEQAMKDLKWLGLSWDEGGGKSGPYKPYLQSKRFDIYEEALRNLASDDRLFPCSYSRRELRNISRAPHPGQESSATVYPKHLRPKDLKADWYSKYSAKTDLAFRFKVKEGIVEFEDEIYGQQKENVAKQVGDFVLKRKNSIYAYQLAVVVDDISMEISEVVRGRDLLDSTARQIQLIDALGGTRPTYLHVPMMLAPDKEKLSKRNKAIEIRALKKEDISPEQVIGYLAHSLGLIEKCEKVTALELVPQFNPKKIVKNDHLTDHNLVSFIKSVK